MEKNIKEKLISIIWSSLKIYINQYIIFQHRQSLPDRIPYFSLALVFSNLPIDQDIDRCPNCFFIHHLINLNRFYRTGQFLLFFNFQTLSHFRQICCNSLHMCNIHYRDDRSGSMNNTF